MPSKSSARRRKANNEADFVTPSTKAKKTTTAESESDVEEIVRPTLYEQIEDQQSNILPGSTPFNFQRVKIPLSQKLGQNELIDEFTVEEYDIPRTEKEDDEEGDEEYVIGDVGQAFFLTVPLDILMVAFDFLVYKQYRDEYDYKAIALRAANCFLPIWFLIYASHTRREWKLVQFVFFVIGVAAGCYLVYSVNMHGYFAVMKRAPPLGALVIWCVYEMDLIPAVATVAVLGGYTWWNEFTLA